MKCLKCNNVINDNSKFCEYCGNIIDGNDMNYEIVIKNSKIILKLILLLDLIFLLIPTVFAFFGEVDIVAFIIVLVLISPTIFPILWAIFFRVTVKGDTFYWRKGSGFTYVFKVDDIRKVVIQKTYSPVTNDIVTFPEETIITNIVTVYKDEKGAFNNLFIYTPYGKIRIEYSMDNFNLINDYILKYVDSTKIKYKTIDLTKNKEVKK